MAINENLTLVVAEKPSVGMSIASVLGAKKRGEGYMEGSGYLVSWCVGHIGEYAEPSIYNDKYTKWRREDLPILPEHWKYQAVSDKAGQFEILKKLMSRSDVGEVVNACDAGREGERIFRGAYELAGCGKPIKRLWISSMEDTAIRRGFEELRPGADYNLLYSAADCRAKADWLVGINATRLFSVLYNRKLNVGRVVSPTLALLVQREAEIEAFQSEPFFTVEINLGAFTAVSGRFPDKAKAEQLARNCQGQEAAISTAEQREKSEKAPALYDLTALQREANRAYGFTAQQTLDYTQALYEKKLCTYPRTDARFLTDDMEKAVPELVAAAAAVIGADLPEEIEAGKVCDSAKVSDHHAIVATVSAGKANLVELPKGELSILRLIAQQTLFAVSPPYQYREVSVSAVCAGETFTAKAKTVLSPGWRIWTMQEKDETAIPDVMEGQRFSVVSAGLQEGKTSPPKHHTEASLLQAMETAGAKDMPEDAERKGLGTPATRAAIIEKLVSSGFVERKKAKKTVNLIPTTLGVSLITVLPEQLQSPLLTAEWEHKLKQVEHGELDAEEFLSEITGMVAELVHDYKPVPEAAILFPSDRESIGKCPRCGNKVTEAKKGFFCENRTCTFVLWKDSKFFTAKKKELTKTVAAALLKNGRVTLKGCWSERTGKTYDATIILEDDGERTNYKMEFENRKGKK